MAQNTPVFDGKQMIDVAKIASWNFGERPAGWYRIAKSTFANGTNALRANATFELRENADHSSLRFEVGVSYNNVDGSSLTITSHSFYSAAIFPKLRLIISPEVYGDSYLEVYVDPHNNNNQTFNAYLINPLADGDWSLLNWIPGTVPAGFTPYEFEADKLLSVGSLRQNSILTVGRNGNVGIGTSGPQQKLSVIGTVLSSQTSNEGGSLFLENPLKTGNSISRWALYNMTGSYGSGLQFWRYSQNGSIYEPKFTITDNGNVGIGTTTPEANLDVVNDIYGRTRILSDTFGAYNGNGLTITTNTAGNVPMTFKTSGADRLTITGTGNVGIGTTAPVEKLTVSGKIKANEIRVDGAGAPDYVFEEDYKVETLETLEAYIKINKHLPEIPSAKEQERDGMAVGEMNRLLLKKIEEITLLLIGQDKEIKALKKLIKNDK